MTDYGRDLSAITDIDTNGRSVSGTLLVSQDVARRITTARGAIIDAPDYGIDVQDYMDQSLTSRDMPRIQGELAAEISKDERIDTFTVTCTLTQIEGTSVTPTNALSITVKGECGAGPFSLVLSVSDVTVELLEAT